MTASIIHCCERQIKALVCSAALLLIALGAQAAEISIRNPQLVESDDGYSLSADMNINFNSRLEEAVNRGVVLFFAVDFELTRSRWYWFDEQVVRRSKTFRLSYHALTRQYRLSTAASALHQSYASLDEALSVMSHLRGWHVLDDDEVKPGQAYRAGLRMRLDLTQMPKTFQVSALANRDWNLSSDWVTWHFTSPDVTRESTPGTTSTASGTLPTLVPTAPATQPVPTSPALPASPTAPAAGEGK